MALRAHHLELYPSQVSAYTYEPPPGHDFAVVGLLSAGQGSGKSTGAAHVFARECMQIPKWDPQSGREQPICMVVAPTGKAIESLVIPKLVAAFPPGAIVQKRRSPELCWTLRNGVRIIFRTGDGDVDSVTCEVVWVDECTHACFLREWTWSTIRNRLRGPGRKRLIVSGIAHNYRLVRDRFEGEPGVFMPGIAETKTPEQIAWALKGVAKQNVDAILHGGWLPQSEQYYDLIRALHCWEEPLDKSLPCHVGLDPGRKACAVVGQMHDDQLVIVDEYHGLKENPRQVIAELKRQGWTDIETVATDSQAALSDIDLIVEALPDAHVIQQQKGSQTWQVDEGIKLVQWALQDGHGYPHLMLHRNLWDHPRDHERGVVKSLTEYRMGPNKRPVRDDVIDHACDVVRYLALNHLYVGMQAATEEPQTPDAPATFRMF